MAKSTTGLLTIQKFIFLLDDFHYGEFISYLENTNASLSLRLSAEIRKSLPDFDSHEKLCHKIYGTAETSARANFNQLSAHTFKLSANLAQNYPGYLTPNISRLEEFVNEGKKEQASVLALALFDIAEKTDDFYCQKAVLQFLCQLADMGRQAAQTLKFNEQLERVAEKEYTYIKIQASLRTKIHSESKLSDTELEKCKLHYETFFNHPCPSIRIISRFASLSCTYHFSPAIFNNRDVECIRDLDKELKQFGYLTLPFMLDLKGFFGFMKLNSAYMHPNSKEGKKLFAELSAYYDSLKFSKNYLSPGELYLTTISGTRLFTMYHPDIHRADYADLLEKVDLAELMELRKKCEDWLKFLTPVEDSFHFKSIKMLYGVFLIVSGGSDVQKGIDELEMLLTTFQQVNLRAATDSIFMCLIAGYFSVKNYRKCAYTFNRFLKSIKGKPVYEGNEVKIYAYYYISQWLDTGGKQYADKLHKLLYNKSDAKPPDSIMELVRYFGIFAKRR